MNANKPWYLLYGGSSADGAGPGIYVGRTDSSDVAQAHFLECKKNPYSTGYVLIVTDTTCTRANSTTVWSTTQSAVEDTVPAVSAVANVRFATIEGSDFAIDWMLRELTKLNPAGEAHYRKVARAPLLPDAKANNQQPT